MGDWAWEIGDCAQSPLPNPQSPIPNPQSPIPIDPIGELFYLLFLTNLIFKKIKNGKSYIHFFVE